MEGQTRGKRLSKKRKRPVYCGLEFTWKQEFSRQLKQDCTMDEWFWFWLYQYKAATVKQGTLESYECMYQYYVCPEFGTRLLHEVKGEEIQIFYNQMARDGYAKATISLIRALLNSMFTQAFKSGYISNNPMAQVILPKAAGREKHRVLTIEEQRLLLKYSIGNELEAIIFTALSTGMRIGEIAGLEWKDINFSKQELQVNGTLKNTRDGKFFKDEPKTGSSQRIIPMIPQLSRLLERLKQVQRYEKTVQKEKWEPITGLEALVFTRPGGKPFTGQHIRQQINRIVAKINKEEPEQKFLHITPHTLRHTFATRALESGISPKIVQELLGHSSIRITLDLYTHVLPETKTEEMKKMEYLFIETEVRKFF